MTKKWLLTLLLAGAAMSPAAATSFSGTADLSGFHDDCTLVEWSGLHSGQILSVSAEDVGKSWALNGYINKCSYPQTWATCSNGTVIVDQRTKVLFCETSFGTTCSPTGRPKFYARSWVGAVQIAWFDIYSPCLGMACERSH